MSRLPGKKTRFLSFFTLLLLFLLTLVVPVFANPSSRTTPFKDIDTTHWGLKNIIKMNVRGVVSGYTDGTFQPNKAITQVEAILMTIRNMEVTDRLAAIDTSQELPVQVPQWVSDYYKAEMLFAVQEGLIVPSENNFNAAAGATRSWVTQLIVRSIGKSGEASQLSGQMPEFGDAATVPQWARGYINTAVKYKLVNGYPDNSFKPYRYVTRAEMVKLLGESEKYLDLSKTFLSARVAGQSGLSLSLTINGVIETFEISSDTWIFDEDGSYIGWDGISENDPVRVIIKGDTVKLVEILTTDAVVDTLTGSVLQVLPVENIIIIQDETLKIHTNTVSDYASFIAETGPLSGLTDIETGDNVTLSCNSSGEVVFILLLNSGQNDADTGILFSINTDTGLIIIKNSQGTLDSYRYADQLSVIIPQIRFPEITDLEPGDEVKITLTDNVISEIELLNARQDLTVSGKVLLLSEEQNIITISTEDNKLEAFEIAEDVAINISGLDYPLLSDVLINDQVALTIENEMVTQISVQDRSAENTLIGTVLAVDASNRIIALKTEDGIVELYEVNSNAEFLIDNETTSKLSEVELNLKIEVQLRNNEIIYLEAKNTVEGSIVTVDTSRNLIALNTVSSGTKSYILSEEVDVNIKGVGIPELDDLNSGDYVELRLENNENNIITDINVRTIFEYQIVTVYEDSDKLKVENDKGYSSYLYLNDRVTLTIPEISSPDAGDFNIGDTVEATYIGNRLIAVKIVP
ncbi:S-layer homology domain-containing protein [Phosphitispora sp. TUW77]|uniref:S-layer homology domain-containing protein n=1 Tax=Phosphitispora sp. TUW77 TaxID=3152361 RepID=UPI003AB49ED8